MIKNISEIFVALSPQSQSSLLALAKQLCEMEGVHYDLDLANAIKEPVEGIETWEAMMISQSYSPASIRNYLHYARRHLAVNPTPDAISIRAELAGLIKKGKSSSASQECKALRAFFGYLYENGLWPNNPMRLVRSPKVARRERPSPSLEEVMKLIAVVDTPKLGAALGVFLDTGVRFTELAQLHWQAVDFKRHEITVIGKGNKQRTIPISPITVAILEAMQSEEALETDFVFHSTSINGWNNSDANKSLARLCKKAGIPRYTCHQLRHFFATYTLDQGGDLKAVSEILGHASASTTVDHYLHTDAKKMRATHQKHSPLAKIGQLPLLTNGEGKDEKK